MATAKKRSKVISAASLSKSIDRAVALAAKRHDVVLEHENIIADWRIVGRQVRSLDQADALDVATTIVKAIDEPGFKGMPAVVKIGRHVIMGFLPEPGSLMRI